MEEHNKPIITKPAITRLARLAGIKSLSEDCFDVIRYIIDQELRKIVKDVMVVNSGRQTETLMTSDVYETMAINGINLAQSNDLSIQACSK